MVAWVSGYLEGNFTPHGRERIREMARDYLARVEFDTIVVRGLSGAMAAPLVQDVYPHAAIVVVRKPNENSHGNTVEGLAGSRWLFVDDLVASGTTFAEVMKSVRHQTRHRETPGEWVGVFTYCWNEGDPGFHDKDSYYFREGVKRLKRMDEV